MPFEIEPWLSDADIQSWYDDQEKWYLRLLLQAWKNSANPCHLPNEPERLRTLAGVPADNPHRIKAWRDRSAAVLRKFVKSEDAKWLYSAKQLEVYVNQLAKIDGRRDAGSKGGLAKASNATRLLEQTASKPSLSLSNSGSLKTPEEWIHKIREIGRQPDGLSRWRDGDASAVEHCFFEQIAEKGADPCKLFEQVCRIYVATDSGKFAPRLADVIRRWEEPIDLWGRDAKSSEHSAETTRTDTVRRGFARATGKA